MTRYKRFRFARLGALWCWAYSSLAAVRIRHRLKNNRLPTRSLLFEPEVSYETFPLPQPILDGETSVAEALFNRRSQRDFQDTELTQEQLAQLLWAAAGVTTEDGRRTAPSAGALYPLDLYVVVTQVTGLEPGLYLYQPEQHTLAKVLAGDFRTALAEGSVGSASDPTSTCYIALYNGL